MREGPETVAAFIGEPLMGAGGVIVPPRTYWEKVQAVLRKHDVLLIADEVINGFGRTGKLFGCETYGIAPDMLVLSKQITSSYMPLAAVLFTEEIYRAVADNSGKIGTFGHGFTTSGHPVAMAVANENLNIIEERDLVGRAAELSPHFLKELHRFASHPLVGEARGAGLIGAVELVADKATKAPFAGAGPRRAASHRALPRARPDRARHRRHRRLLPAAHHRARADLGHVRTLRAGSRRHDDVAADGLSRDRRSAPAGARALSYFRCLRNEFFVAIRSPSKVRRSQPSTCDRVPCRSVPTKRHSDTPRSPATTWRPFVQAASGKASKTAE